MKTLPQPLIEVSDARVVFGRDVVALDHVSLCIAQGDVVGLVGESGSGKSTLARVCLGLQPLVEGSAQFAGRPVRAWLQEATAVFRRRVQMVFQDPYGSLNPRLTVGLALAEVLRVHRLAEGKGLDARVVELLEQVGLDAAYARRYPHELSGGQRQRVGIARALAVQPDLLIADEPVSALDVSVQVQLLNLLKDLQAQHGLALLFIAHDLATVRYLCRRVAVMFRGRLIETGPCDEVLAQPAHPYTSALRAAVPEVARGLAQRGSPAPPATAAEHRPGGGTGCEYRDRCARAVERCRAEAPRLRAVAPGRHSACHFAEEFVPSP